MFYALEKRDDAIVFHIGTTMPSSTRESLTAVFTAEMLAPLGANRCDRSGHGVRAGIRS
jgi:hypothetical protein